MEAHTLFSFCYDRLTTNAREVLKRFEGVLIEPEELVAEAFLRIGHIDEWPRVSSFLTYTLTAMNHIAGDSLRMESGFPIPELVA